MKNLYYLKSSSGFITDQDKLIYEKYGFICTDECSGFEKQAMHDSGCWKVKGEPTTSKEVSEIQKDFGRTLEIDGKYILILD